MTSDICRQKDSHWDWRHTEWPDDKLSSNCAPACTNCTLEIISHWRLSCIFGRERARPIRYLLSLYTWHLRFFSFLIQNMVAEFMTPLCDIIPGSWKYQCYHFFYSLPSDVNDFANKYLVSGVTLWRICDDIYYLPHFAFRVLTAVDLIP